MFFAGIDIGSLTAKTVIINNKKEIIGFSIIPSGANHKDSIIQSFNLALNNADIPKEKISYIISTGYGRINVEFANKQVTEIACHGRGAFHFFPKTQTIIDIGGQDTKVIKISENGKVIDFIMNDKCAAGTGKFLEVMANTLQVKIDDLESLSMKSSKNIKISSICGIFAESEVISKIAQGESKEDIIKGLHNSISERISSMVNRVKLSEQVTITGGGAKNKGVINAIEEKLNIKINVPSTPQIIGALGASIIAMEFFNEK